MAVSGAVQLLQRDLPRTVSILRWFLPGLILVFVIVYEAFQAWAARWVGPSDGMGPDLLIYGLIGPIVTWRTLSWIAENLARRAEAEAQVRQLNRELEAKVDDRTRELVRANEELQEIDRLKSEFMNMVSHELRAPLTNISGAIELLAGSHGGPDARSTPQLLGIIADQSDRLTQLVEGILKVSRIEAGHLMLTPSYFEIGPVILRAMDRVRSRTRNHQFRMETVDPLPPVWADQDRVEQILAALLDNAVKYAPEGGPIVVRARSRGLHQQVSVSDAGMGIPEEHLSRIFEKFHRVDTSDAKETYGHGLGLYLARRLVEVQGGKMWAESQLGEGSTFHFTLPMSPGGLEAAMSGTLVTGSGGGRKS